MNTRSPVTETELKAKQADDSRITEDALDANIACTYTFTASQAVQGNAPVHASLGLLTICVIVLRNGFTVTGESACVDPANFDRGIGERIAYQNAKQKVWALMGYELKERRRRDQALLADMAFSPGDHMHTFIGTKVVNAKPMTRLAYNTLRGWTLPADENGDDVGYLVEYTDRVENHVLGYLGYVSWSPKDVFERAYRRVR